MTLNPRQPRPLVRDAESLRDDRLFIVACDGTFAPKQYSDFYRLPRIKTHVVRTMDGTSAAPHVPDVAGYGPLHPKRVSSSLEGAPFSNTNPSMRCGQPVEAC